MVNLPAPLLALVLEQGQSERLLHVQQPGFDLADAWLLGAGTWSRGLLFGAILFLPLAPAVFRYSRVIWMHLDQVLDPRSKQAGN